MKTIRRSVFETNSSSTHSISLRGKDVFDKLFSKDGENVEVIFGEYGWGYDKLTSSYEKLCYVVTSIRYFDHDIINENIETLLNSQYYKWLKEMVKEYSGYEIQLEESDDDWYKMGYVDHQSTDTLEDFWSYEENEFKSNMKELIFNNKYTIIIDNDNH